MIEIPKILQFSGNGEFQSEKSTFSADFLLTLYPTRIDIATQTDIREIEDSWVLNGFLADGRSISCDKLIAYRFNRVWTLSTGTTVVSYRFTPHDEVKLGHPTKGPIREALFPLVSYYKNPFELQDNGWEISASQGESDPRDLELISENWRVPMEGLVLRLSKPDATIDEYLEKVRELSTLLSLASGNSITFHRQIYRSDQENEFEIWRFGKGGDRGIGEGLVHYQHYLKEVLPTWRSLSHEDQRLIRIATTYLIGSAHGYMEDKLLNITIAWEMLANAWPPSESRPSEKITELKNALKKVYLEWSKNHPDLDDSGFLWGRISQALDWEKVIKKIEQLANDFDIDSNLVGTNFRRLVTIRNSVAHDGVLPQEDYSDEASRPLLKLLLSSRFALRVLLLKKLNYTGLISSSKDGRRTFVDISEAEFDFQ